MMAVRMARLPNPTWRMQSRSPPIMATPLPSQQDVGKPQAKDNLEPGLTHLPDAVAHHAQHPPCHAPPMPEEHGQAQNTYSPVPSLPTWRMPSRSASRTAASNHLVRASMKPMQPGTPHSLFSNMLLQVHTCREEEVAVVVLLLQQPWRQGGHWQQLCAPCSHGHGPHPT